MGEDIKSVSMLVRREIEALIAVPLLQGFSETFGKEKTLAVAGGVIRKLAMDAGKMMAELASGNTLANLETVLPFFSQGGALELDPPAKEGNTVRVNVTRCAYAEMYRKLGLAEFGYLLSCGRDFALFEGFNPGIEFTRTQTIMEGADHCDFCLSENQTT